jgi:outer membrane putative beta-barrel porin/alpha-amylase
MTIRWNRLAVFVLATGLAESPAYAQSTVRDIVTFLMTNQAVETGAFEKDREAAAITGQTMTNALLVNLTSVPIATSSSGFLYRLNPELGTVERATQSFGAFFVERALTPGRGHASFGVAATTTGFDKLDGLPLRDGRLVTIANQFRDEPAPYNTESLTLRVRTSAMTVFASVGVTDRFEIGGAVPFVRLTLDGQRLNVYRGEQFVQASAEATASGVADIALRAKYTLVSARTGGVAAAAEVRLPTGDADNLLGAGSSSWRLLGVGSVDSGRLSLHGNAGIVRGGVSDEVTFGGAASVAVQPRVTVSGEVIGRRVSELHAISLVSARHPTIVGVDTVRLSADTSAGLLMTGLASIKWNVGGTLVLGGHLAWPLTDRGLTAPLTPTFALEYAF